MARRGDGDGVDGDLPPDPWAGLAATPPPPPPTSSPGDVDAWERSSGAAAGPDRTSPGGAADGPASWHPAGHDVPAADTPSGPRSLLGHPAVWVIVTAVALLALWTAWMDRPSSLPSGPSPDSVSTAPFAEPAPDAA